MYSYYLYNFKYSIKEERYIEAKVISKYSISEKYIGYICNLKYSGKFKDKFIVYIPKEQEELTKGDKISFYSKIVENSYYNNYNEFNSKLYLNSKCIVGTLFVNNYSFLENVSKSDSYKDEFGKYLDNKCNEDISKTIQAILYGDKDFLPDKIKDIFNDAGVSHVLVVSGTAIYFLKLFLYKIFKNNKFKEYIILVIISLYVFFCSFSISIFRAYIMFLIPLILKKFKTKLNSYIIIGITAFILLFINPYYIFSYSFWYTFMAVLGIRIIFPRFNSKLSVFLLNMFNVRHIKYVKRKILFKFFQYIFTNISLTISVQIILFPIILFSCNKIYILSIFSNFIINVFSSLEYILGFILIISFKIPIISHIITYILGTNTKCMLYVVDFFARFDNLSISFNKINILSVIFIYLIIIYFSYDYIIVFKLKKIYSKQVVNILKKMFVFLCIVVIAIDGTLSNFFGFVYYFNVGQGNMAIAKYDNVTIVSDIGSNSCNVKYILKNFIKAYNLKQIDYLFLSHMHDDHINGLFELEEEIKTKQIIIKNICARYVNEDIKDICKKYDINIILLKSGDNIYINNKIQIEVLSPNIKSNIISSDIENSNSLVYIMNLNSKKFMFMGDATNETEKNICNMQIKDKNIFCLQVGHHGSKTSTCIEYLKYFSFRYATISSEYKVYKHPSDEVKENLQKFNITYFLLEKIGGKRFYIY